MPVKVFDLHVVGMAFVMLNLCFFEKSSISHRHQTDDRNDHHTNKHCYQNHFFGPYNTWVTATINIAEIPIPQPKMTAELGSLKKSISVISLTCLDHTEGTEDRRYPETDVDPVKFRIWTVHEKEQVDGKSQG